VRAQDLIGRKRRDIAAARSLRAAGPTLRRRLIHDAHTMTDLARERHLFGTSATLSRVRVEAAPPGTRVMLRSRPTAVRFAGQPA
jgi:hypothetical protein